MTIPEPTPDLASPRYRLFAWVARWPRLALPAWTMWAFVAARLLSAYTWYWGASTKTPWGDPPYGWLESWLHTEAEHNPIPGYPWLVENVFLPNLDIIGWMSFLVESYLAAVLFLGFATRWNGWLAALWGLNISIGNIGAPREAVWSLVPMILLPFLAAETRSGRLLGVDAWLRPRLEGTKNTFLIWLHRYGT